jgi:carbon-monoxide dehydrogenase medium subunit
MKPPAFTYHDPRRIEDALALLGTLDNARVLAGGQSLMPMLNMRMALPDHLIDLNRVAGLDGITLEGGALRIRAMTRQRALEDHALVRAHCPLMAEALTFIGHRQTRNRGTIGGSLCNLDPAAELVSVCSAQDAVLEIAGRAGRRELAIAEFPLSFMTPALEPDELLAAIRLPLWPRGHGACFTEFARRHGDYAIFSAAVLLVGEGGRVTRASVTRGGVGAAPLRMAAAEALLVGAEGGDAAFRAAAAECRAIDAMEDPQVPGWYRRRLAEVLVRRSLATAWSRIGAAA